MTMQVPTSGTCFCFVDAEMVKNRNVKPYFPNKCMKILVIEKLKNKLGQTELMIGTDVLKITLRLVRCINKHHYLPKKRKIVVHKWCESAARCDVSGSEYHISITSMTSAYAKAIADS